MKQRMKLISRDELKTKLDRGDDFKLLMTLGQFAYDAKHIPGSIQCDSIENAEKNLDKDEEIVIYCAGQSCHASVKCYELLTKAGFKNVRRYAGGITDWEAAGYPVDSNH